MHNLCRILFLFLYCTPQSFGQNEVVARLVIVGNAYEAVKSNDVLLSAIKNSVVFDSNTIVLYLGNYTRTPVDTAALRREAAIIQHSEAKAFFIPGFRDWANGKEAGYKAVRAQQRFLESLGDDNIKVYPGDGCPGFKEIKLGDDVVMLIMDSQWWLHEHSKPDIESDCKYRTKDELLFEIEDVVLDNYDKMVLFVSHHPMKSTGVHSGTFGIKQHVFPFTDIRKMRSFYLPLPLIGSLYPLTRHAILSKQNMHHDDYKIMTETGITTFAGIKKALEEHPHTLFIAGQEHNMELLKDEHQYFIMSGAAAGGGRTRKTSQSLYNSEKKGFTVVEISKDKKLTAAFYTISGSKAVPEYVSELMDLSKFPPLAPDTAKMGMVKTDSIIAVASESFAHTSSFRHFLIGENYRKEWSAPVKMRVLNLSQEKGGLKITGMGGGHESRNLQLEDKNGVKWSLRSVNKNLEAVIPEGFHETVASDIVHEMLTGSHPYGDLVVPGLLEPLNVVHASPEVVFVPNDTLLKEFRPLFANTVMHLEERRPALNKNETINTERTVNDIVEEGGVIDQRAFVKARLTDFLISDFDRHRGQWSWGTIDTQGLKLYYPIPKDRDQALYNNEGLIMKIASRGNYAFMTNFRPEIKKMKTFGLVGAHMDMFFSNELTESDWKGLLSEFKTTLNDSVIGAAVKRLPPEIYAIRGPEIRTKLITRRNIIADRGLEYYRFMSRKVNVIGSNKDDFISVTGDGNSKLLVKVFTRNKDGDTSLKYSRLFDPEVTKEIRLYGFNGDDYFNIDETANSTIKLMLVGGKGEDSFNIRGKVRNQLYDLSMEDNQVLSRSRTTKLFARDPSVNEFRFREVVHNRLQLPLITVAFNEDDGLLVGAGMRYQTYGFRKYPYASRQRISGLWAVNNSAYRIKYKGEFNHVFRRYDLTANADLFNPALSYFFGYGNETKKDPSRPIEYYRVRYDYASADLLARKRFLNDSTISISVGPSVYYYWNSRNRTESRILEFPSLIGLDSAGVYTSKFYGGGKAVFEVNNVNSEVLPTRGIDWITEFTALKAMNNDSEPFTRLTSTLDLYATLRQPSRLIAALHLGGGHIFSERLEYFQALTIGGKNYLRGFRRDRFAGSSMFYGSLELRMKLFDFNAYLVKGDFGVVGFNDVGRVWVRKEQSNKWHHGYGGGIYVVPFNAFMFSAIVGISEEDKVFNASLGAKLNIVFQ